MLPTQVAAAPISWGVCEVAGWGVQLPAERVLAEMADLDVAATELGPAGFLPTDPAAVRAALADHGLRLAAGFVPVVLHRQPIGDQLALVERAAATLSGGGADTLVLAAATGEVGYDSATGLGEGGWATLLDNLRRADELCQARGLTLALHPHVGTVVEGAADVERVLDGSDVGLCLDTGHLLLGGTDPVDLARSTPERVAHVHLKDVDAALAGQVADGALTYTEGVAAGLYRPLGQGDVDITSVVATLDAAGYPGWYVLEQDVVLGAAPPAGTGPVDDVRASLDFLKTVHR